MYENIKYIYPQIKQSADIPEIDEEEDLEYLRLCKKCLDRAYEIFMKHAYGDQEEEIDYRLNQTKFADLLFMDTRVIDLPDEAFLEEIKPEDEDYLPW